MTASTKARTTAPTVSRRPPLLGLLAALAGIVGALIVGFSGLIAWGFSGGILDVQGWLVVAVPLALSVAVLIGVALLVTGRGWRLLSWTGLLMTAAALVALLGDGNGPAEWYVLVFFGGSPLLAALLAATPSPRTWVAARVRERAAS